ncbi:hypothetical protein B0H10DRAFT_1960907 [Mycena sp. CBHHK59/15]|nr:hypothetical protein B0H10DRAFT_1960907 [Mycena sp. CBHHK59/15]
MRCSSPALSHLLWLAWPGSALPTRARFMPPMVLDPMQGPSPMSSVGWAHPQALSTSNRTRPTLSGHAFDSPGSVASQLCLNDESRWVDECGLASWTANRCPVAIGQGRQPPSMPEFTCTSIPCIPVTQLDTDLVAYILISHIKCNCVNCHTEDR